MKQIQEIDIYSQKGNKISAHIVSNEENSSCQKKSYGIEIIVEDIFLNKSYFPKGIDSTFYDSREEVFQKIINTVIDYWKKHGEIIVRVNNPCNTEFLSADEQQKIIDNIPLNLQIEVNS